MSFFSMVVYWLTRADCDLEILTFSPVMEGSPVIAIRFALTALTWTAKGGDVSGELAVSGTAAPLQPLFDVHSARVRSSRAPRAAQGQRVGLRNGGSRGLLRARALSALLASLGHELLLL